MCLSCATDTDSMMLFKYITGIMIRWPRLLLLFLGEHVKYANRIVHRFFLCAPLAHLVHFRPDRAGIQTSCCGLLLRRHTMHTGFIAAWRMVINAVHNREQASVPLCERYGAIFQVSSWVLMKNYNDHWTPRCSLHILRIQCLFYQ